MSMEKDDGDDEGLLKEWPERHTMHTLNAATKAGPSGARATLTAVTPKAALSSFRPLPLPFPVVCKLRLPIVDCTATTCTFTSI
jgi:hypothetical protein